MPCTVTPWFGSYDRLVLAFVPGNHRKTGKIVLKCVRAGAMAVVVLYAGAGVAAADPVGLPDMSLDKKTDDGWHLNATLKDMEVNSVPNMGATAFTREGYVSATAKVSIDGKGAHLVTSASVGLFYQLSCQIEVPNGVTLNPSPEAGVSSSVSTSLPTGATSIGLAPAAQANPQTSVQLQPGMINTMTPIGQKGFKDADLADTQKGGFSGQVSVQNYEVHLDNCAGPVFVRLHAEALMTSGHSDDSVEVFSDIMPL